MTQQLQLIQLSSLTNTELDNIQYNNWITSLDEVSDFDVFETACRILSKTSTPIRKVWLVSHSNIVTNKK